MDILFVHSNYPAQFRRQLQLLASCPEHRLVFATERQGISTAEIPKGVRVVTFSNKRDHHLAVHPFLTITEDAAWRGQAVAECVLKLRRDGFQPQLVIFHAGRGLGICLRDLLPQSALIAYCEWYFKPEDLPWLRGKITLDDKILSRLSNAALHEELLVADHAVTPTSWQHDQFPPLLAPALKVIFDGIDTHFFSPPPCSPASNSLSLPIEDSGNTVVIPPGVPVLTYATRGMEPLRGFPEFLGSLPSLLRDWPELQVVVAGRDRRAYSYDAPEESGSWKNYLLAQLGHFPGRDRLHFVGLLPYRDLRSLMHRSDLHVYFSRPFVPSWSLFEAAACGVPLALNDGPGTSGLLPKVATVRMSLDEPQGIPSALHEGLTLSLQQRSTPRRSQLPTCYHLEPCMRAWAELMNNAIQRRRSLDSGVLSI